MLLVRYDRSGRPTITTRVGLSRDRRRGRRRHRHPAASSSEQWAAGRPVDYLIVDEAGFLTAAHVDQLAELVDDRHVDVYCFGLPPTSAPNCFPAPSGCSSSPTKSQPVHVEVLCWCGRPGQLNARVDRRPGRARGRHGRRRRHRRTRAAASNVRYQVLCRMHHRRGDLGAARRARSAHPRRLTRGAGRQLRRSRSRGHARGRSCRHAATGRDRRRPEPAQPPLLASRRRAPPRPPRRRPPPRRATAAASPPRRAATSAPAPSDASRTPSCGSATLTRRAVAVSAPSKRSDGHRRGQEAAAMAIRPSGQL